MGLLRSMSWCGTTIGLSWCGTSNPSPYPGRIDDRPTHGYLLWQAARLADVNFREVLATHGLSPDLFVLLKELQLGGPQSPGHLAAALSRDASNLTTQVAALERRGLLRRERAVQDGRRVVLSVTTEGDSLLAGAQRGIAEGERHLLRDLSAGEADVLYDLVRRIARPGAQPESGQVARR